MTDPAPMPRGGGSNGCHTVLLLAILMSLSTPAAASIFDTHGYGARSAALANAMVAVRGDFTATYYNPAGLVGSVNPQLAVGFDLVEPMLSIRHGANTPTDGPQDVYPGTNLGIHLGGMFPLFEGLNHRIALGFLAFAPMINPTRIEVVDRVQPHFHRYNSQSDALTLGIALAGQVSQWISIGAGVHILGGLRGGSLIEIDLISRRFVQEELVAEVNPEKAFNLGLIIHPTEALSIGLSFRESIDLPYSLTIDTSVTGIGRVVTTIYGQALYTPTKYALGTHWSPTTNLRIMLQLDYELWSLSPDPSARFSGLVDGSALGFGGETLTHTPTVLGAVNTLSPRMGVEYDVNSEFGVRMGYAFLPTPLPVQTGPHNYVDSNAHQLGIGGVYRARNPWARHSAPIHFEVAMQLLQLASRDMVKETVDDPVGSYSAGGPIWHSSFTIRHLFD
jgi:long-subunit fatty acid transport protein